MCIFAFIFEATPAYRTPCKICSITVNPTLQSDLMRGEHTILLVRRHSRSKFGQSERHRRVYLNQIPLVLVAYHAAPFGRSKASEKRLGARHMEHNDSA
jgi:hypothetical protein